MMAIAVAAISFTACSNDLTEDVTPSQEFTVQINAVENLSRTHFGDLNEGKYPTLWDATDKIAASLANGNNKLSEADPYVSDDSKNASFKVELNTENATAPYVVYAVSPSSAVVSGVHATYKSWTLNIPSSQTPTDTSCDPKAQIVVGQSESSETLPSSVNIEFSHVTAYAKINFTNVALGEAKVESISIEADQYIAGRFYHYVAGANVGTTEANSATKIITIDTSELTSELTNVWVALAPTAVSELTFTINTDQGSITKEVTGLNKEFKSGVVATFNVDMNGIELADPVKYELLTDANNLKVGDKVVIAAAGSNFAISTTQNSNNRASAAITKSDDKKTISDPSASVEIFTVEEGTTSNTYAFKATTTAGYIYAASSSKNYMRTQETLDANGSWIVTVEGGVATIKAQGTNTNNWLRYNTSGLFSCYGATNTQADVVIYHMEGDGDVELIPSITAENISGVAAEGVTNATTTFTSENLTEAITVTCDGIIVTAAAVAESTITYTVSENTTEETREGWIKLAANGVEVTITVSQLAPISGDTATGTIDFSNTDQRESQDSNSQVWSNAGITLINSKESSTTNVGDYKDPARFYKNSSITISAPSNITKLYFECDDAEYATALKNSIGSAATASGTNVTVVLDGTSDTFTATLSEGKVFVNSLSVTYISTGQEIQTLSFDPTEKSANLGEPFTAPTLSGAKTAVTYSSSNTAVATVDENTGAVTLKGAGITTITATAEKTDKYFKATASYTLTVIDPNATVDYTTENTSNVTLSTTGGTSAYTNSVQIGGYQYDAIKLGTGNVAGAWKVTVPAGTTKLHLHLAGWNGESVKVGVSGATTASLTLISDSGVSGNGGPFKISTSDSSSFYHELTLSNVTEATTLTFTATSGKRFVVWGVNAE